MRNISSLDQPEESEQKFDVTKEWLDTKDAAKFLSVSEASLLNMVTQRKIVPGKLGRRNRYHVEDLLSLISFRGKRVGHGS
jgi:hypothetical protein